MQLRMPLTLTDGERAPERIRASARRLLGNRQALDVMSLPAYDESVRRPARSLRLATWLKMRRPVCGLRGHPQVIRLTTYNATEPGRILGSTYTCHCGQRHHFEERTDGA